MADVLELAVRDILTTRYFTVASIGLLLYDHGAFVLFLTVSLSQVNRSHNTRRRDHVDLASQGAHLSCFSDELALNFLGGAVWTRQGDLSL